MGVEPNLKTYGRRNTEMFETPDLTGKSDEELVAMMTEYMPPRKESCSRRQREIQGSPNRPNGMPISARKLLI